MDKEIESKLESLAKSKFRSKFHLKEKEKAYIQEKGLDCIKQHAFAFVENRIAPAFIPNDGKQTPMRGHPVFIAQHATATCCRECLFKWHQIPKNIKLSKEQQKYIVTIIMKWIEKEI